MKSISQNKQQSPTTNTVTQTPAAMEQGKERSKRNVTKKTNHCK